VLRPKKPPGRAPRPAPRGPRARPPRTPAPGTPQPAGTGHRARRPTAYRSRGRCGCPPPTDPSRPGPGREAQKKGGKQPCPEHHPYAHTGSRTRTPPDDGWEGSQPKRAQRRGKPAHFFEGGLPHEKPDFRHRNRAQPHLPREGSPRHRGHHPRRRHSPAPRRRLRQPSASRASTPTTRPITTGPDRASPATAGSCSARESA